MCRWVHSYPVVLEWLRVDPIYAGHQQEILCEVLPQPGPCRWGGEALLQTAGWSVIDAALHYLTVVGWHFVCACACMCVYVQLVRKWTWRIVFVFGLAYRMDGGGGGGYVWLCVFVCFADAVLCVTSDGVSSSSAVMLFFPPRVLLFHLPWLEYAYLHLVSVVISVLCWFILIYSLLSRVYKYDDARMHYAVIVFIQSSLCTFVQAGLIAFRVQ